MRAPRRPPRHQSALLLATAAALLARLWALGDRVAHQDEGRVGHWILHYVEYGQWEYRAIIHGPFLPHVNGVVFSHLGASDFTARLAVAVLGGLLPLAAWLFRERLSEVEIVALGAALAIDPVLLYYSRFVRNDVPLAAAMLVAVGLFVRALDARRPRYLLAATAAAALGFTMKENAVLYPVCWAGALALVLDRRLLLSAATGERPRAVAVERLRRVADGVREWWPYVALSVVEFAAILAAFYAPKPALYGALADPTALPSLLSGTGEHVGDELGRVWLDEGFRAHSYPEYLGFFAKTAATTAWPLLAAAVGGALAERYDPAGGRPIVGFCFLWGLFSLAGYPAVMDVPAAWSLAHVHVPLAVPAAVGVGLAVDRARPAEAVERIGARFRSPPRSPLRSRPRSRTRTDRRDDRNPGSGPGPGSDPVPGDRRVRAVAAVLLLVGTAYAGTVAVETSYLRPQGPDNPVVQYAQPAGEIGDTLEDVRRVAAANDGGDVKANDGVDVMYYGGRDGDGGYELYAPSEAWEAGESPPPGWYSRLPLPWYFERYGATVASADDPETVAAERPPVVIALGEGAFDRDAGDVEPRLDGYDRREYHQYQRDRPIVFFVDESRVPDEG